MEVALSAQWLLAEKQQFLKVTAALKNTGASRIPFDLDYSVLEIYGGGHSGRKIADLRNWRPSTHREHDIMGQIDKDEKEKERIRQEKEEQERRRREEEERRRDHR